MEGRVSLVGWPVADSLPTTIDRAQAGKIRQPETDVVTTEPRRQHTV